MIVKYIDLPIKDHFILLSGSDVCLGSADSAPPPTQACPPVAQDQTPPNGIQNDLWGENSWNSMFDSLLDPDVAAYLDAAQ